MNKIQFLTILSISLVVFSPLQSIPSALAQTTILAPSNLTATAVSQTQINLTWIDNSTNEVNFYIQKSPNGTTNWDTLRLVAANSVSYSDTSLQAGQTRYYRVRAEGPSSIFTYNPSAFSNIASATTQATPPAILPPSNLTAAAVSPNQINLGWQDNSTNEFNFRIQKSPNGNSDWDSLVSLPAGTTSYADTSLNPGQTRYYRVRAESPTYGNSTFSNVVNVTTPLLPSPTPTPPAILAPSNLTATAVSTNQSNLSWSDNSNNEFSFRIQKSPNGNSDWDSLVSLPAGTTSYADTSLSPGQTRYYRVRAESPTYGNSSFSNTVNVTTPLLPSPTPTPPAILAPSNLTATAVSQTQINLTWIDNSTNEVSFYIQKSPNGNTNWDTLALVAANSVSYSDTSLQASQTRYYRVRAEGPSSIFGSNPSTFSNIANATTQAAPPAILPPSNLTATAISTSQINLSWSDNSNNEFNFRIQKSPNGNSDWDSLVSLPAGTTSYADTSLSPGQTRHYRVRAESPTYGNSTFSNFVNATTPTLPPAILAPSNLTAVFEVVFPYQINLGWQDNSNNEFSFRIQKSPNGNSDWDSLTTVPANTTTYQDASLSPGQTRYYRVRAESPTYGNSSFSNTVNVTTPLLPSPTPTPPAILAPSNLTATAVSTNQINLSWSDNSTNEFNFRIQKSPNGNSDWDSLVSLPAGTTSYADTSLNPGQTRYYRVRAESPTYGNSTFSNFVNATTPTLPPAILAPSNLTATSISPNQINLSWQDNSTNEFNFRIQKSPNGNSDWDSLTIVQANNTAYQDTSLSPGQTRYYRVRAESPTYGDSTFSNIASAITPLPPSPAPTPSPSPRPSPPIQTPPEAPSNLIANALTAHLVLLTWADNSMNEFGFKVERSHMSATAGFNQIANVSANYPLYINTPVSPNNTFWYRVRSFNANGNSSYSNVFQVSTPPPVTLAPAAPSNLEAENLTPNLILLTWQDNSNNEFIFKIERSQTSATRGFIQIGTVTVNFPLYVNTPVSPNSPYWYRVRAFNGFGNSAYSNVATNVTTIVIP